MKENGLNRTRTTFQRGGIFYGWFVLAACFAANFTLGEAFWSFGVYVRPLEQDFGWSRALTSSVYSISILGYALSAFFFGRLADKHGPRWVLFASGLLAAAGMILCGFSNNIWQLRLFFLIVGVGAGATFSVPTAVIQRWFNKYRGLTLGIVTSGVGVGAIVFAPMTSWLIGILGWRNSFFITGVIYGVIITASSLIIIASPDKKGLRPYGVQETSSESKVVTSWTSGAAIKTRAYLTLATVYSLALISSQIFQVHLVSYAIDHQVSETAAATALGLIGGFSVLGRLGAGLLSDKLGWQRSMAIAYFGCSLAVFALTGISEQWALYAFVAVYGICHGGRVPPLVGLIGHFFGTVALAELIGICTGIAMVFGATGPYVAGFLYDVSGNYAVPFTSAGFMLALGGILILLLKPPAPETKLEN